MQSIVMTLTNFDAKQIHRFDSNNLFKAASFIRLIEVLTIARNDMTHADAERRATYLFFMP
jgi:hypothetical protein